MAIQDYLNFELNIEALDGDRFRITVTDSPVGSAAVEVANPFTADEIAHLIGVLEGTTQVSRAEIAQTARTFGEKLFNTVFSGQIFAAYLASQDRAGNVGLRIKLALENAGMLEEVPWELLRDPRSDYLVLSRQTPVIRYPRLLTVRPLVDITLPLRVLVMISAPKDQEGLNVEGEWQALQDSTANLRSRGLLEIERLDDAQLITLQRKLREGQIYHIFHYIGHAAFDDRSESGMLAFENPRTGASVPVSGESLARELSEENSIRLVVLNACQGARENAKDPFAGVASSIVARGVPAVVAMQFSITDEASRIFSQEFYRALSEGYPIEAGVAEARRTISSTLNNVEWATPVLYLRAPTGILFPKRRSEDIPISAGGLRELLRRPIVAVIALLAVCAVLVLLFWIGPLRPHPVPTPTATPAQASNVDLTISTLRFVPPNPAPGQRVTVAILLKNNGTTDSGPFKWAWFTGNLDQNQRPPIEGDVPNLAAGASLYVKGEFPFGWWGSYITTAWVNVGSTALETNFFNNILVRQISTSNDPFLVDFTMLPDGSDVLDSLDLKGGEFSAWGIQIAPSGPASGACVGAIAQIHVDDSGTSLSPGLPGHNGDCDTLPIGFSLSQPVGGATVDFVASISGAYKLDLIDGSGNEITSASVQANAGDSATISAPASGSLGNVRRVVFSSPPNGTVIIKDISFNIASNPVPTATVAPTVVPTVAPITAPTIAPTGRS